MDTNAAAVHHLAGKLAFDGPTGVATARTSHNPPIVGGAPGPTPLDHGHIPGVVHLLAPAGRESTPELPD